MTSTTVIKEVKLDANGRRQEFLCRLLDHSADHAVVLYTSSESRQVGNLRLPKGTLTYGYFWHGRPYNVYHWVRPDGRTLGFYVNLADETRIRPGMVEWRDLGLDLLFSSDGRHVRILDEDDLAQLDPGLRAKAESAKADVLTHRDELLAEVAAVTGHLRGRGRAAGKGKESVARRRTLLS